MSPPWIQYCLGSVGWINLPATLYSCTAEQTFLQQAQIGVWLIRSFVRICFLYACTCFCHALCSLCCYLLQDKSLRKSSVSYRRLERQHFFLSNGFSLFLPLFYISVVVEQVFHRIPHNPSVGRQVQLNQSASTAPEGRAPEGGRACGVTRWGQMKWIGHIYGWKRCWKSVRVT